MTDINLIPDEAKRGEEFDKLKGKVTLASVVILILAAVAAFVTLAFYAYFITQRGKLVERVEAASTEVNRYKAAEELIVVTKDKATTASQIIAGRQNKVEIFTTLTKLIPQSVNFSSLTVVMNDLKVSGRAKSSADVAGLVSALLSSEGSKIISNVNIDSLASDETGVYTFGISAKLLGK